MVKPSDSITVGKDLLERIERAIHRVLVNEIGDQ